MGSLLILVSRPYILSFSTTGDSLIMNLDYMYFFHKLLIIQKKKDTEEFNRKKC